MKSLKSVSAGCGLEQSHFIRHISSNWTIIAAIKYISSRRRWWRQLGSGADSKLLPQVIITISYLFWRQQRHESNRSFNTQWKQEYRQKRPPYKLSSITNTVFTHLHKSLSSKLPSKNIFMNINLVYTAGLIIAGTRYRLITVSTQCAKIDRYNC